MAEVAVASIVRELRMMNRHGWVFAGLFLSFFVLSIFLAFQTPANSEISTTYFDLWAVKYGGFIGGVISAIGTVFAGYLAFVATSNATLENTKQLIKSDNNRRAAELREFISWFSGYLLVFKVQHDVFRELMNSPHTRVWRDSVEHLRAELQKAPKLSLIYPVEIEDMSRAVNAKLSAAAMMITELSPMRGVMPPQKFDAEIGRFLAYNIDHVSIAAADAKSIVLILNQAAHKYRNLEIEFDGFRVPDRHFFDEIADEFAVDRQALYQQVFSGGLEQGSKYRI